MSLQRFLREPRSRLELSRNWRSAAIRLEGICIERSGVVHQRAQELSRELNNDRDLFTAIRGLDTSITCAPIREAARLADEVVVFLARGLVTRRCSPKPTIPRGQTFHFGIPGRPRLYHQSIEVGDYRRVSIQRSTASIWASSAAHTLPLRLASRLSLPRPANR